MNPFFEHLQICEVRLKVRDLAASIAFYEKVVGLELIQKEGLTCVLTPYGEDSARLVLTEDRSAPAESARSAGLFHVAWLLPTRSALGATARRLMEHSALSGTGDHGVSEALYLDDPDGNGVEIWLSGLVFEMRDCNITNRGKLASLFINKPLPSYYRVDCFTFPQLGCFNGLRVLETSPSPNH